MQQVASVYQCFDGSLNTYLFDKIIALFDDFTIQHVSRDENTIANDLAQQALGFQSNQRKFSFLKKTDVPIFQTRCFGFWPMQIVEICSIESNSAEPDGPVSETSRNSDNSSETTITDPDD
jgi:hypothetical protein